MKLKGFSLFELLFTLMLSGFLLLIGNMSINIFNQLTQQAKEKQVQQTEALMLHRQVQIDMQGASSFLLIDREVRLFDQERNLLITYFFEDDQVRREGKNKASFDVRANIEQVLGEENVWKIEMDNPWDLTFAYRCIPVSQASL